MMLEKEQEKKLEDLKEELAVIRRKVVDAETSMETFFNHTADTKAQNRLLLWYTLMLTHTQNEDDENPVPYFEGDDFDEKIEDYYLKEEEASEFYTDVIKKALKFVDKVVVVISYGNQKNF